MKSIITALALLLLLPSNAFALNYKGKFSIDYVPSQTKEGLPIHIDAAWEVGAFVQEPYENISFTWQFPKTANNGVWVNIIPFGETSVKTVFVPLEVARTAIPYDIKFVGEPSNFSGGTIEIDGGAVFKDGSNFNVAASPNWNEFICRKFGSGCLSQDKVKELLKEKNFSLSFFSGDQRVSFDLNDVKMWYAKQQRRAYKEQLCKGLLGTYEYLSHRTDALTERQERVTNLCRDVDQTTVGALKKESEYLDKLDQLDGLSAKNNNLLKMANLINQKQIASKKTASTEMSDQELAELYGKEKDAVNSQSAQLISNIQSANKIIQAQKEAADQDDAGNFGEIQFSAYDEGKFINKNGMLVFGYSEYKITQVEKCKLNVAVKNYQTPYKSKFYQLFTGSPSGKHGFMFNYRYGGKVVTDASLSGKFEYVKYQSLKVDFSGAFKKFTGQWGIVNFSFNQGKDSKHLGYGTPEMEAIANKLRAYNRMCGFQGALNK